MGRALKIVRDNDIGLLAEGDYLCVSPSALVDHNCTAGRNVNGKSYLILLP